MRVAQRQRSSVYSVVVGISRLASKQITTGTLIVTIKWSIQIARCVGRSVDGDGMYSSAWKTRAPTPSHSDKAIQRMVSKTQGKGGAAVYGRLCLLETACCISVLGILFLRWFSTEICYCCSARTTYKGLDANNARLWVHAKSFHFHPTGATTADSTEGSASEHGPLH